MNRNTTIHAAIVMALVATLIAPAAALAMPGRGNLGNPKSSTETTRQARYDQRLDNLTQRLTMVLANRSRGFNAAAAAITSRIDRVSVLASKVESASVIADVSDVRTLLQDAKDSVEDAKAAEVAAVALFKAVPNATDDKRAKFAAAKAEAKVARQTLQEARTKLREAILGLRSIVNGLKGAK